MDDAQVCFSWYRLAQEDRVKTIDNFLCSDGHGLLHPFVENSEDGELPIYFECLACNQRVWPGSVSIEYMRRAIMNIYDEEQLGG